MEINIKMDLIEGSPSIEIIFLQSRNQLEVLVNMLTMLESFGFRRKHVLNGVRFVK
jgi:hypothetical protein